jgi:serine protease Do
VFSVRNFKKSWRKYFGIGLAALLLAGAFSFTVNEGAAPAGAATGGNIYTDNPVVQIVKDVSPAVVNIDVESVSSRERRSGLPAPFQNDPLFRRFFGEEFRRFSRSVPMKGRGSGFIVSKDGQILTNNHVVEGADKITVTLSDGKTYEAQVLGKDPTFDLAVIKIKPEGTLTTLELGDSNAIEVGEWVVAIGNPYGLEHSVTVGVISAKNRSIHTQGVNFDGFLQTDAAINPGNSGGPLLGLDGRVIGINTAIIPYAQGLGFAIPVNMAKQIMGDLVTYGSVKRGWLGISIQPLTEEFAEAYSLKEKTGVVVGDVFADSAAERAGLQRGDVITSVNRETVKDTAWFVNKIRSYGPNTEIRLDVIREGKTTRVTVKLDEMPNNDVASSSGRSSDILASLGISVTRPTSDLRRQYGLKSRTGLVVTEVTEGSSAQAAGVQEGDLLLEINGRKVSDERQLGDAARRDARSIALLIERGGRTFFVSLKTR